MDRLEHSSLATTLVELLRYRAIHQSDRTAYTFLVDGESQTLSLTYQELDRCARAIAAILQSADLVGERAVLLYPPGLEYIAAFFGCLYAGVVAVPAYPPRPNRSVARIQSILADAKALVALTTSTVLSTLKKQFPLAPELKNLKWLVTDRLDLSAAENWSEPDISKETLAFLQYTSGSTAAPKGVAITHQNLIHNSKGIYQAFEHSASSSVVSWLPMYHDMGLIGGVLQPLYGGFPATLMSPLMFLQRPLRWLQAISRYRATSSGGPNFAYDLCARKISPEQLTDLDLSCWDVAFNGAEPISQKVLEQFATTFAPCGFRQEAFYPCYGLAEATLFVSGGVKNEIPMVETIDANALAKHRVVQVDATQKSARAVVSCGRSLSDQKIAIVDPKTLEPCQPGEIGEIWVLGPSVARGYWQQPEATERTFCARTVNLGNNGHSNGHHRNGHSNGHHRNGHSNGHHHNGHSNGTRKLYRDPDLNNQAFLRTGDLGFIKNGELFVTGRLKDVIIINGRNHYPQDIEWTVEQSHPFIRPGGTASFAVETEGEEKLVVVAEVERSYRRQQQMDVDSTAVSSATHVANSRELLRSIRQAVAKEHDLLVHTVLPIKPGSLPKTSSGKVQRHACKRDFMAQTLKVWES